MLDDDFSEEKPSRRKHLVAFPISREVYDDFYKVLIDNGPVYYCVLVENKKPRIFIEKYTRSGYIGVCRVFWKKKDIQEYIERIKIINPDLVSQTNNLMPWEISFKGLVTSLSRIHDKEDKNVSGDIKAVACSVIKGDIRDVEVLWTSKKEDMI